MRILYSFGVLLYAFAVRIAALSNSKAKKWISGRKDWKNKLPNVDQKVLWFHCASLGEFDQGLPVVQLLREKEPDTFILVTFFSPSGMEHYHKRQHPADHVMYLPIDTIANARFFLNHFKPSAAYFIKYEFWCNYILEATEMGIPVYSISTLLREDQRFFKWYGTIFRETLKAVNHFYVQNEETGELLERLGIQQYTVVGDTRFDRVIENSKNVKPNPALENFLQGQKAIIIGSSWPEDEAILYPFLRTHPEEKIIIAPHDIREKHLAQIEEALGSSACRYTALSADFKGNIVLLDTIGQLANAYSYGKIAYVGGGFSGKLHNILEPAVFGLPVLFGPKHNRFPEAALFIREGIGFTVNSSEEFENRLHSVDHDLNELTAKTVQVIRAQQGAAGKCFRSEEPRD
jgi:3-deoxy-D-manno-octulosonic-acid transferase